PWTSAALVIGGLSLIGVPGTAGFISKWVLVQAALEKDWWPLAVLIVLSSLLAVIYVWRMVEALYLAPKKDGIEAQEVSLWMLGPIWIMAIACIYFGLATDITLSAAQAAAKGLLAGTTGMH
ncbi:MAG: proton-conducting transporter membrane subunit, partial [Paracoccaceae bacterium]